MSKTVWHPNSKPQETFLALPDDIFEAVYGGAAGGGKTETLIYLPLVKGFHQDSKYKGITFRRTFKQLERSLIPRAKEVYLKIPGTTFNASEYKFTFASGASHWFGYLETDDHARQYDTDEYNLIMFEELAHFSYYQYIYLTTRCRTSSNLPAIMRNAATPGNIGNKWVYDRFVKPARGGYKVLKDKKTNTTRIFIPAKASDNPDLTKNDPTYINRLSLLPAAERRAKIEGDWLAFEGAGFPEFRIQPFTGEPENARHVIPRFPIPHWWPKVVAIDWGYDHATAVIWIAISPEGRKYVYRTYKCKRTPIKIWGADIQREGQYDQTVVDYVIDPSALINVGAESTVFEQVTKATGWNIRTADNDRISGRQLLHEELRWEPLPKRYNPATEYDVELSLKILRNAGEKAWKEYENSFVPDQPETNLPKLQIFESEIDLIEVIPQCSNNPKKPEDILKFDGDDFYDCIRYALKAAENYVTFAIKEFDKRIEVSHIVRDFEQDRDWTRYHRRMEAAERKPQKFGVKLKSACAPFRPKGKRGLAFN
jgi:hypothetical protein